MRPQHSAIDAMNDSSSIVAFLQAMNCSVALPHSLIIPQVHGTGSLLSAFPLTALAVASIGAAASAMAEYVELRFGQRPAVSIDRRLASIWFGTTLRPLGWQVPAVRDPVTGDYSTQDGWIRIHANAPHHRAAALSVLNIEALHNKVAQAVRAWESNELEDAILQAGGCAAAMRTQQEWNAHQQGKALAAESLFQIHEGTHGMPSRPTGTRDRPLAGIKVLDLTRVLAGPVATRFLAAYGAQVLRIDSPFWTEPGVIPEVTLGKRCAGLDLREAAQLAQLRSLIKQADVFIHGYRPGALERMGLGEFERQTLRPGLVDVCLNAYGWTGPWRNRRGFDSLVQMSTGIAQTGMTYFEQDKPVPLPVQGLDHATGYLMAAAALRGLARQLDKGQGSITRLSLARTAALLASRTAVSGVPLQPETANDLSEHQEFTDWGPARRVKPPCEIQGIAMRWDYPAGALRSSPAQWIS